MDFYPLNIRPKYKLRFAQTGLFVLLALSLVSCKTQKQVQYMQGAFDTSALSQLNIPEPIIQKGDLIGITVYSDNPEVTASFNQQMNTSAETNSLANIGLQSSSVASNAQNMPGYIVDAGGNIQFQALGELHIEGLTKAQLSTLLKEKLAKYLKNPYCNVRFLNYKFTIIGEVTKQGVYSIPGEKINILEALGIAGDMTIYGLKDSIIVVREANGKRSFGQLDVSSPNLFVSPYYYLQQNDVVIVKSSPKKPSVSDQANTRNLALIATIATIVTSLAVLLNIFLN